MQRHAGATPGRGGGTGSEAGLWQGRVAEQEAWVGDV